MFHALIDGEYVDGTEPAESVSIHAPETSECGTCCLEEWEHEEGEGAEDCAFQDTIANHVNGAGINVRTGDEPWGSTVDAWISVGDPRGGFQMRLEWRHGESVPEEMRGLYLSVPTPTDGMPHMGLETIRPGWYRVRPYSAELYDRERLLAERQDRAYGHASALAAALSGLMAAEGGEPPKIAQDDPETFAGELEAWEAAADALGAWDGNRRNAIPPQLVRPSGFSWPKGKGRRMASAKPSPSSGR